MTTETDITIYRLTDMKVEEVSLVDRAANKRKFLIVKGASNMSQEVKPDGKGGHVTEPTKLKITAAAKSEIEGRVAELTALCASVTKHLVDVEIVADAPVPDVIAKAVTELDAAIAKGLKQFTRDRQAKLLEAMKTLGDVVKEVVSDEPAPEAPAPAAPAAPAITKTDIDAVRDEIRADMGTLVSTVTAAVAKLTDSATAQAAKIETLEKSSRGTSNANTDASATPPAPSGDFTWPIDMNRPDLGKPSKR